MATEPNIFSRAAPSAGAIRAVLASAVDFALGVAKAFRHRRDLEVLAGLDDRMLADIGLTRSDLRFALSEPFWRDPAAVLTSRAGERRSKQNRAIPVPRIVATPRRVAAARPAHRPA